MLLAQSRRHRRRDAEGRAARQQQAPRRAAHRSVRKPEGHYLVAVDTVDAGVGETVLIVSGSSARMASGLKDCPVDAAIVGVVDHVDVKD